MKDIVIVGAGGFGREVAWLIEDINKVKKTWNILGFVDDNLNLKNKSINGYKVLGTTKWLKEQNVYAVVAIGDPIIKNNTLEKLDGSKISYATLIHPSVIISETSEIGLGSIICAGTIITVNVHIGNHVIVNLDCTIGHDVIIKDCSTLLPSVNVSGEVKIGNCVNIGTGAAIIQNINIVNEVVLGAGAVVVKDINEVGTYVGIPAKKIN